MKNMYSCTNLFHMTHKYHNLQQQKGNTKLWLGLYITFYEPKGNFCLTHLMVTSAICGCKLKTALIFCSGWPLQMNLYFSLTLPVRGSRFCGCEGGGLPKPPPRNQWWNDMRYYVAIDKMFIDRFRDHMQKFWKKSQKLAELWIFEKFPRSAPKNCRHTKMHAIRPKLNIFSSSFFANIPISLILLNSRIKKWGHMQPGGSYFLGAPLKRGRRGGPP